MQNITKIYLASDHAGFEMKEHLQDFLSKQHYEVVDHGNFEYDEDDDYPEFVAAVAQAVAIDHESRGIILGGSGQGEAIMANRFPGIRAVVFNGQYEPQDGREVPNEIVISREHNDSNILSLGARFLNNEEAEEAVTLWLETAFSGEERHRRRNEEIDSMF